jgi:phytanoyl-CoA hydroxylase
LSAIRAVRRRLQALPWVSVWLALGHEEAGNGALKFIPSSHRIPLAPGQMDELDFLRPDVPENQALFAKG